MCGHRQGDGWIDPRQLFDTDAVVDHRQARSTVRLGHLNTEQTERGHAGHDFDREMLGFVPLADVGTDLGFGELPHAAAEEPLFLGEAEVHPPELYHRASPRRKSRTGRRNIIGLRSLLHRSSVVGLLAAAALAVATPARADLTAFIGSTTTPVNRLARGFAAGAGLLVVGWEVEYAYTVEDPLVAAPSERTVMGNVLLQTPIALHGFQPYATAGLGWYRETLGTYERTGFAPNTGFGVKVTLFGPIRLRVDYRALRLGSGALYSPAHRIYAGLNLKF